jgi:hypothetical protein
MTTITIRADYEEAAKAKLDKLVKKAAGYGHVITYSFAEPRGEERETINFFGEKKKYTEWFIDVTVEGEAPRVGNHTLMARLTREAGGVIVDKVPGIDDSVGELGRAWAGTCEHCNTARDRAHGFIVREDDKMVIVGRTCLRDYLGIDTPEKALWIFQWAKSLDNNGEKDDGWGFSSYRDWWRIPRELLAATSAAIDLWGWAPKSGGHDFGDTTQGRVALLYATNQVGFTKDERARYNALVAELRANEQKHYERADAVIAWGETLVPGPSDYLHNLKLFLAATDVKANRMGYVCSAVPAYERALGRKLEAERRAKEGTDRPASQHVGKPGERITVEAVVDFIRALPADRFGDCSVYTFFTDKGEKLSWMTSAGGVNVEGIGRGDRVKLVGTVKDHAEYKGVKETRLNRCKLEKIITQEKEAA